MFKKKYDEDKNDYINSFRILITNKKKEKLRYEELLIHIDKNYDNKNDLKSEYLKLFLKNDQLILTVWIIYLKIFLKIINQI